MLRRIRRNATLAFVLLFLLASACATGHVVRWGEGGPSLFRQPGQGIPQAYAHTLGTILAAPVAFVWDVATFPVQLAWGYYPYGSRLAPESTDS